MNARAEELKKLICKISAMPPIEWKGVPGTFNYPDYPGYVFKAIDLCSQNKDYNYPDHIEAVKSKDISTLTIDEIATYMTFIERGERFCDGHIQGYLEDGTFIALMKRMLELIGVENKLYSTLTIKKIGITKLKTDAIVNAANDRLAAGGGVCGAIFNEAGYSELTAACRKIGGCPTGSAVITPGFNLSAKYIIHAVGPVWHGGKNGEEKQLHDCYYKSMTLAMENGLHSIGFPLISSGIYGYPKPDAWRVALSTIMEFRKDHCDYNLDVTFAVLDQEVLELGNFVLAELSGSNTDDGFVFFWKIGHKNEEFSNWYKADFIVEGVRYSCVEQYMVAKKAIMFGDTAVYSEIMNEADPANMKKLGKLVSNFKSYIWDRAKDEIVYNACYAKFSQNEDLKAMLRATGNAVLAEASPADQVWGIGMAANDPQAKDPSCWKGENRLGNILMKVRTALK